MDYVRVRKENSAVRWRKPHLRTPGYVFGVVGIVDSECLGRAANPEQLAFREAPSLQVSSSSVTAYYPCLDVIIFQDQCFISISNFILKGISNAFLYPLPPFTCPLPPSLRPLPHYPLPLPPSTVASVCLRLCCILLPSPLASFPYPKRLFPISLPSFFVCLPSKQA